MARKRRHDRGSAPAGAQAAATPPKGAACLISAIMIVKNERAHIERSLRSLLPLVDEIVVVDTGSTDGTPAIARALGARVFSFEWCNDFSAARNESIRHARGAWLIWIDADEELLETEPGALRALCLVENPPEGYLVTCKNLLNEHGAIGTEIRQWRLFRNHIGLQLTGRIHEHLTHADGRTTAFLLPQEYVWIRHWGYIIKGDSLKRKRERNFPLLELALKDEPHNPFHHYNLGKQFLAEHQFEPGLHAMEQAIHLWREQGGQEYAYVGNMFALAINAAVELHRNQQAVDIEALVPAGCLSPDILFQAGVAWWRLGYREEGRRRLERAWQDPLLRRAIEADPSHATWRPLAALADMHLEMGEPEVAYDYAKKAHAYAPSMPNILYALAFIAGKLKLYDESIAWARKLLASEGEALKPHARRLLLNIGQGLSRPEIVCEACSGPIEGVAEDEAALTQAEAYGRMGNVQAQYDVLDAAHRHLRDSLTITFALADFLDSHGFVEDAASALADGIDTPNASAALYERLALQLTKLGRFEDATNALKMAERLRSTANAPLDGHAPSHSLASLGQA